MDVFGFRIIVERVEDCYRTLGVVHNLFKPVAGRFKDYIAIPKANGYQSLHTSLFGMHGVPIEVQIRTRQMDAVAEHGIAGHWLYKAGDEDAESNQRRARQWMQDLLELQRQAGDPLEFIESLKLDLFPDEVYVFTPTGEIMELAPGRLPGGLRLHGAYRHRQSLPWPAEWTATWLRCHCSCRAVRAWRSSPRRMPARIPIG